MCNRPIHAYIWIKVLSMFKKGSLEDGSICFSKQIQKGNVGPWIYFFDILMDPQSQFCFLKNDRKFQENALEFISRNVVSIPNYLIKRFCHVLPNGEDVKKLKICLDQLKKKKVPITVCSDSETAPDFNKRRLSSPVLPESKHACLEKSHFPNRQNVEQVDISPLPFKNCEGPRCTDSQKTVKKVNVTKSVDCNITSGENSEIKLLPINRLLELDNPEMLSHLSLFSSGYECTEFSDISYEHLKTILARLKNSQTALQNFICSVVVPFIASKQVCNRNDSAFITDCFGLDFIDHVVLVLEILRTCKKQIIDGTAKIVSLNPTLTDKVLCGLADLKIWTEDVTGFLASTVKEKCSVSAVEHVMQYLIECSDEKSPKSCTLVMRILASHGKEESIVKLCAEFAEQNKCFLKKALLQKLENFLN